MDGRLGWTPYAASMPALESAAVPAASCAGLLRAARRMTNHTSGGSDIGCQPVSKITNLAILYHRKACTEGSRTGLDLLHGKRSCTTSESQENRCKTVEKCRPVSRCRFRQFADKSAGFNGMSGSVPLIRNRRSPVVLLRLSKRACQRRFVRRSALRPRRIKSWYVSA